MKRYVKAATSKSLEESVGLPFDLSNDDVQYEIAHWTAEQFMEAVKKDKYFKKRGIWLDDLSWSSNKIHFVVMEGDEDSLGGFTAQLNYYDEPSESYDDVEYLIKDAIREWMM